ncbi:MAG: GntR family transcriptional regulator [Rhodospirillaceae bacterium]|nr:GntR family transcriptional regulator [Rhodospirillaceae bacterium]MBT6140000.1 GntR family transcriptional regulator [Rhodospirillaceae bacterium]
MTDVIENSLVSASEGGVSRQHRSPLYHQILLVLRQQIEDGLYRTGDRLPGEFELASRFDVSRITVKRALNELVRLGLVKREQGRGTTVTARSAPLSFRATASGRIENLRDMGLETQARLLAFDYVSATANVAEALEIQIGETVQRAVRVRSIGGEPFSYLISFVPERIGRSYEAGDLDASPLLSLIEATGAVVARAHQSITATLADTEMASELKIDIGAPLLIIRRVVFDADDIPVEYLEANYRPNRYEMSMELNRVGETTLFPVPFTGDFHSSD